MPVYYIVGQYYRNPSGYGLYQIVETIEGNFDMYNPMYPTRVNDLVRLLNETGQVPDVRIYIREPANPFRKAE